MSEQPVVNGRNWGGWRGGAARVARLARKELREILRDRRTIITLIVMPLLLYPLLSVAFQRFLLTGMGGAPAPTYRIGVADMRDGELLQHCLNLGEKADAKADAEAEGPLSPSQPIFKFFAVSEPAEQLQHFAIDLAVRFRWPKGRPSLNAVNEIALDCELSYLKGSALGERARAEMERRLHAASQVLLAQRMEYLETPQRPVPLQTIPVPLDNPEGTTVGAVSLASLVPLILILMTITGAVYPAIDLTAGERERGTLEMLVAAPVPRLALLFAKYVAVVTVAFLTATVNLISMSLTITFSGLGKAILGDQGLPLLTVLEVFGLLILFAAFFSGVLLTLCSFARSFKEAQAYLIPLMLLSLAPGLASLLPGLELRGWLLVTPLLNIALLSRDLLEGHAHVGAAAAVVLCTSLCALGTIALAARLFGTDAVLYGNSASWGELFARPAVRRTAPSLSTMFFCLMLMFPACFLLSSALALSSFGLTTKLWLMCASTAAIFMGMPLAAGALEGVAAKPAFRLSVPGWAAWPGAALLGLSLWPFVHELSVHLQEWGALSLRPEQMEKAKALLDAVREQPLALVLAAFALAPAVCEEFCFRGYAFSALGARLSARNTILASGLLFGVFHLVATDALAIEKLLPTALLGIVLSWVGWRTGSVYPGMLLHFLHNGFLMTASQYQPQLVAAGWGAFATDGPLPRSWLMAASAAAIVGAGLVQLSGRGGRREGTADDARRSDQ